MLHNKKLVLAYVAFQGVYVIFIAWVVAKIYVCLEAVVHKVKQKFIVVIRIVISALDVVCQVGQRKADPANRIHIQHFILLIYKINKKIIYCSKPSFGEIVG